MKHKLITIITVLTLLAYQVMLPVSVLAIETPQLPETPEMPDVPEQPETPETTEEPEQPESPQLPAEQQQDEQETDDPSNDVTEELAIEEPQAQDVNDSDPHLLELEKSEDLVGVDQSGQIGDVTINTGDSTVNGAIVNSGNLNLIDTTTSDEAEGINISAENNGNGEESDNNIRISISDDTVTNQVNNADLNNNLNLDSNTGDNIASRNTGGDSKVDTGNANVSATITNLVNTNVDGMLVSEFDIADDHTGDIVLEPYVGTCANCGGVDINAANNGNGEESDNDIDLSADINNETFQSNDADIENTMLLSANSGNNDVSRNTDGDSIIDTGDANVSANVVNLANNNLAGNVFYSVVNIFGDLIGDIILPDFEPTNSAPGGPGDINLANNSNGSDSANEIGAELAFADGIYQFNEADINNNIIFDGNTGANEVSRNTDGDNRIDTGDVSIDGSIVNVANNNIVGGKWWFVVVNQAGEWLGNIIAPDGSLVRGGIALSQGNFSTSPDGDINIANNSNGSDSQNTANLALNESNMITQQNKAVIDNNITLAANTGGNTATKNTGGDSKISTGDANMMLNIFNFTNNNIYGDVYFTVVNVFGSWTGDFLAPGAVKAQENGPQQENDNDSEPARGGSSSIADNFSSSDSGAGSTSSSSTSSESSNTLAQVAAATYYSSSQGSLQGKLASGVSDETNIEKVLGSSSNSSAENKLRINLAYLLPLLLLFPIVMRRYHINPFRILYLIRK